MSAAGLERLRREVAGCRRCPRLVAHREQVAREKRRAYRDETYWGRPVPGFGDPGARILLVGLAPGAHGSNRTGRMFTGDASGDFLYPALHRAGLSSGPRSIAPDDGLALRGCWITAVARCAPPGNRPSPGEIRSCRPWLQRELDELADLRVIHALGKTAFDGVLAALADRGPELPRPRPRFAHAARFGLGRWVLTASYHPSRQNTQTGKLTAAMFDAALALAVREARAGRG